MSSMTDPDGGNIIPSRSKQNAQLASYKRAPVTSLGFFPSQVVPELQVSSQELEGAE